MAIGRSLHGDMLPLVFGFPFAPELKVPYLSFTSQQASLAQTLITYVSNFATSGNPNGPYNVQSLFKRMMLLSTSTPLRPLPNWSAFSVNQQNYLRIGKHN